MFLLVLLVLLMAVGTEHTISSRACPTPTSRRTVRKRNRQRIGALF